jgi:hypothetical protein
MKYNTKHIEEHHEDLMFSSAKSILCGDDTVKEELSKKDRHHVWLNDSKYEYMRKQIIIWENFLSSYLTNITELGKNVKDVLDYDSKGRSKGKKEDIIIVFSDNTEDKVSIKTLKTLVSIQTYSSTFLSFILSLIFDKNGVNNFKYKGKIYTTSKIDSLIDCLSNIGYDYNFIENVRRLKNTSKDLYNFIKQYDSFFDMEVNGLKGFSAWELKCKLFRDEFKPLMLSMINTIIEKEGVINVTRRCMITQGIIGDHSTIIITPNKYVLLSKKNINPEDIILSITECSEGLRFNYKGDGIDITSTIPLTINRNGAYNLNKDEDNKYFKKDKKNIPFGMIRPVKSKQIATSTNTYIKINNLS